MVLGTRARTSCELTRSLHAHVVNKHAHALRREAKQPRTAVLVSRLVGHFQGPFLRLRFVSLPGFGPHGAGSVSGDVNPSLEAIPHVRLPGEVRWGSGGRHPQPL